MSEGTISCPWPTLAISFMESSLGYNQLDKHFFPEMTVIFVEKFMSTFMLFNITVVLALIFDWVKPCASDTLNQKTKVEWNGCL